MLNNSKEKLSVELLDTIDKTDQKPSQIRTTINKLLEGSEIQVQSDIICNH